MSGPFGSSQWMYNSGGYEIENSVRLDGSGYFQRTPSSSASTRVWTFSTWIKRSKMDSSADGGLVFLGISSTDNPHAGFRFQDDSLAYWEYGEGGTNYVLNVSTLETARFRDPSAWAHVMLAVNTTHGTASNRIKIYWNGVLQTLDNTNQGGQGNLYPDENEDLAINSNSYELWIGGTAAYGNFDGYMADTYFINNQQLTPASFGETGTYGEFKPIEYTGTYDAYSSYLDYADSGNLGDDESGNGVDFAEEGVVATDQVLDTPTNNFATFNPLAYPTTHTTLSEGNLSVKDNGGNWSQAYVTQAITSGKIYVEFCMGNADNMFFGITTETTHNNPAISFNNSYVGSQANDFGFRIGDYGSGSGNNEGYSTGGSFTSLGTAQSVAEHIYQLAIDLDNAKLYFGKQNTWYNSGDPAAGSNGISISATEAYFITVSIQNQNTNAMVLNAGQDSSFAAIKTPQGKQDSNGRGDFFYAPPSGFLALCTKNLPEPVVIPSEYFNAQIWSGDSSGDESFTTGFQPDLVWFLMRNVDGSREMVDSLRGVTKVLSSDTDVNEFTEAEGLQSFDANGFSLGTNSGGYNRDSRNYLGFSWRAGGGAAAVGSNTDGSINTTDTSAAVEAGFSISTYTGTGATATVGHGLSKVPEIIFVKNRTDDDDWCVFFGDGTDFLRLNTTLALTDDADRWNDTVPTTSVFTVDTDNQVNGDGDTYVAYSFHSVEGHSKIGTYTGNGAADGVFVYLGFRPKFLMCKKTSGTESWWVVDTARKSFNPHIHGIELNATADELAVAKDLDLLANGFKTRKATGYHNDSATYMYMAFAEVPFKYANSI
jgi:hypothetical protein